jgi:hypothetical protein
MGVLVRVSVTSLLLRILQSMRNRDILVWYEGCVNTIPRIL